MFEDQNQNIMCAFNIFSLRSRLSSAVLYVEVQDANGDRGIGTAFHIGSSYCVTARHVINGKKILRVGRRDTSLVTQITAGRHPVRTTTHGAMERQVDATYVHPDGNVDVAIIKLGGPNAARIQPFVLLSPDADLYTEGEFLMEEVLIFGYPPIPWSDAAHLVVFRGDVSAVIENTTDRKRHFVISGMARGGFSGGPVVTLDHPNEVLGVVANSLMRDSEVPELGFIGAVSVQTVFEIVEAHQLRIPELDEARRRMVPGSVRRSS